MFFESTNQISDIARRTGTAVFVVPSEAKVSLPRAIVLQPENKTVIAIEQVKDVIKLLGVKQTSERFIMIRPAEALSEDAANALLKSLEEPGEKVHFVLITDAPSRLLPTILSRASVYFLREKDILNGGIQASEKAKDLAKRLMAAKSSDLVTLADEIAKKKDGVRGYALEVLGAAIEMLYKTYFITGKEVFAEKLPKFLAAYEAVARNGHVKLQIVASLV